MQECLHGTNSHWQPTQRILNSQRTPFFIVESDTTVTLCTNQTTSFHLVVFASQQYRKYFNMSRKESPRERQALARHVFVTSPIAIVRSILLPLHSISSVICYSPNSPMEYPWPGSSTRVVMPAGMCGLFFCTTPTQTQVNFQWRAYSTIYHTRYWFSQVQFQPITKFS